MHATAAPPEIRDRILDSAIHILRNEGVQRFTQTRVATHAKVRQSHVTYYFPTRQELLEATAERVLDGVTGHIAESAQTVPGWGTGPLLNTLAREMLGTEHMRMFLAMVVESDRDPAVRALIAHGTTRVHAAITAALGGGDANARKARAIQTAIWGLGLYTFTLRPSPDVDPTDDALNYLEEFVR
jgi:AcrR family transcriptional regulator